MWYALNTVKSQMILNTTEPKIVRIAGRSECPIPLSAPPLISYEPSEHEYNAHTACENTAEKHTKPKHLFASVKLKCAVVLTCECNGCLAERTYYIVCNVFKVEFSR